MVWIGEKAVGHRIPLEPGIQIQIPTTNSIHQLMAALRLGTAGEGAILYPSNPNVRETFSRKRLTFAETSIRGLSLHGTQSVWSAFHIERRKRQTTPTSGTPARFASLGTAFSVPMSRGPMGVLDPQTLFFQDPPKPLTWLKHGTVGTLDL